MTQPEREDDFEAFLKRRTVLPHGMSVDDELEPPGALDERVLRKAREAIRADKQSQRAPRWAMPMAIAATVLLCFSIVLNVRLNTSRPAVDRQGATVAREDKPTAVPPPVLADVQRSVSEPAAAPMVPEASMPASDGAVERRGASADTRTARAIERVPGADAQASAAPATPAAEPTAAEPTADVAPAAVTAAATAATAAPITAAPPPPTPGAAAQAPLAKRDMPPPMLAAKELHESENVTGMRASKRKSEGDAQSKAPASDRRDPKTWLKQIDALRAKGRGEEADAEMQRFRAAFPSYPVQPATPGASAVPPPPVPSSR